MSNPTSDQNDIINLINKKFAVNEWKGIGKISGVYKITNNVNGKYYVGGSKNIINRWYNHVYELRHHQHDNIHLQRSWDNYGENSFLFLIIEASDDIVSVEQKYLDIAKNEQNFSYNQQFLSGRVEMTEEMKKIIGQSLRKRYTKHKHPMLGRNHTLESRQKMSVSQTGKILSEKTKDKIRKSLSGKNGFNYGKSLSSNTRKKLSDALRGRSNKLLQDKSIYTFKNRKTLEKYTGTQYDFIKKYTLNQPNVNRLTKGIRPSHKDWVLCIKKTQTI